MSSAPLYGLMQHQDLTISGLIDYGAQVRTVLLLHTLLVSVMQRQVAALTAATATAAIAYDFQKHLRSVRLTRGDLVWARFTEARKLFPGRSKMRPSFTGVSRLPDQVLCGCHGHYSLHQISDQITQGSSPCPQYFSVASCTLGTLWIDRKQSSQQVAQYPVVSGIPVALTIAVLVFCEC